jgi:hypothetical protein
MKNIYLNRLQKKRNKGNNNSQQTTFPLKQYINNGNSLNSFFGLKKLGVNRSVNFKNENKSNNNLINSYNQTVIYSQNYKNRNDLRCNNHSLFDSNKQQIINIDDNNNYIRFESYNTEKENKKANLSRNNSIFNSSSNKSKNIGKNYSYQKNYFNNNITNINYNINIQNFTVKKNNTSNDSNNNIYYSSNNNNNKTTKYISHIKDDSSNKSNNFSNYKNNYNFTEINYTNKNKNETNKRKEPMKRNLTENNHLKRKSKEKEKEKYVRSSSKVKLQVYNLKQEKTEKINNIRVNNIKEINNKLPIKLNIEDINKEKLSRLKRIIEQGSTNIKNYKMEISKNLIENNAKTPNKTYNKKKVNAQYIFKKKKINVIKKEERKEGNININNQKKENNFLTKSSIKNTNKKPRLILNAQLQHTNYKNKLGLKTNNYFLHKEKNIKPEIIKENKYQRIKYNEMVNNNNDDTISLSYSKEQNISFFSKKFIQNEKSISLPFLIEQFFLYYNKITKDLIITDRNKKNKEINIESDDDDYQLTKEIILLKRGLTEKSELSKELLKKMRKMRIQRVCNMNLFGNKKIYKKKMST